MEDGDGVLRCRMNDIQEIKQGDHLVGNVCFTLAPLQFGRNQSLAIPPIVLPSCSHAPRSPPDMNSKLPNAHRMYERITSMSASSSDDAWTTPTPTIW
jgi:hypothetical protein